MAGCTYNMIFKQCVIVYSWVFLGNCEGGGDRCRFDETRSRHRFRLEIFRVLIPVQRGRYNVYGHKSRI